MSLIGYQFDLCEVPPSAEAMADYVNSGRKNKVLKGYLEELNIATSGLNIIVGTGAAMIFGRLLVNASEERVTVRANASGYLVLTIDLTQSNTATGIPGTPDYSVINRQIRLEVVDSLIQRDLFSGEYIYTFPLARYTSSGTTVTLTKNVESYEDDTRPNAVKIADIANNNVFKGGSLTIVRSANVVQLTGTVNLIGVASWSTNLIAKLPERFWPLNVGVGEGVTFSRMVYSDNATNAGLVLRVTPSGDLNVMRNQFAQTTALTIHETWIGKPI